MKNNGLTLIELLFALGILAILASFSLPLFSQLYRSSAVVSEVNKLASALAFARHQAISSRHNVLLCASSNGQQCDKNWTSGYMVFRDHDNNGRFNRGDYRLNSYALSNQHIKIRWRSFRRNKPIRFLPSGITWHNNGTFVICFDQFDNSARALIVNKSGRVRGSQDNNQDGINEDSRGRPLNCQW